MDWAFLVDENLEPQIATLLEKEGYPAEHVTDALGEGTPDRAFSTTLSTRI